MNLLNHRKEIHRKNNVTIEYFNYYYNIVISLIPWLPRECNEQTTLRTEILVDLKKEGNLFRSSVSS